MPLHGATVSVRGPVRASVQSDAAGLYSFGAVPDGTYTVEVAHQGYKRQSFSRSISSTQTEFKSFELEPGATNPQTSATDINNDGQMNSIDIQLVINAVLSGGATQADVNQDNQTNASDVQLVINAVLGV